MKRAVTFYRDVLGLEPGIQSPYWSDFHVGDLRIGLHPGSPEAAPKGGWRLGLLTPDLSKLRKALLEAGATILEEYHQTPQGVVLTFADPDGNPIQALQRGVKVADLE